MMQSSERNHSQPDASTSGPAIVAMLVASIAALTTFATSVINTPESAPIVTAKRLPELKAVEPVDRSVQRAVFYDQKVEPRIADADALNREAANRCVKRITQMIDQYRDGVDPFINDLTSLSTRFGIIKRMPSDWWNKETKIENFVEEKFEKHLFSEQKLMNDIASVLQDFKDEVDSNQKRMLVQVKSALGSADLPEIQAEEYEPFFEAVASQLQRYSAKQGTASVQNAGAVFVISETAGTLAGRTIVIGLLARFGTTAVVSSAAGATATAGTTAAGTGTGALGGPVGAAVGFGIGLAVGLVVDWWMTEQFESKMSKQMNNYLDALEDTILYGGATQHASASQPKTDDTAVHAIQPKPDQAGLVDALPAVCDRLKEAYRERFYEHIVTGTSEQ